MKKIIYTLLFTILSTNLAPTSCVECLEGLKSYFKSNQVLYPVFGERDIYIEPDFRLISGKEGALPNKCTPQELCTMVVTSPKELYLKAYKEDPNLEPGQKLVYIGPDGNPINRYTAPNIFQPGKVKINVVTSGRFNSGDPNGRLGDGLPTLLVHTMGGRNCTRLIVLDFYEPQKRLKAFMDENRADFSSELDLWEGMGFCIAIWNDQIEEWFSIREIKLGDDYPELNKQMIEYFQNPENHRHIEKALEIGMKSTELTRESLLCLLTKEGIATGKVSDRVRDFKACIYRYVIEREDKEKRIRELEELVLQRRWLF